MDKNIKYTVGVYEEGKLVTEIRLRGVPLPKKGSVERELLIADLLRVAGHKYVMLPEKKSEEYKCPINL